MNPTHNTNDKKRRAFWERHVTAWRQSCLTRVAYCRMHELPLLLFQSWSKRLTQQAECPTKQAVLPIDERPLHLVPDSMRPKAVAVEAALGEEIRSVRLDQLKYYVRLPDDAFQEACRDQLSRLR